jgi:hypothetical protein
MSYEMLLVICTGLLVIVGIGQLFLFFWQLRLIRKSLDVAELTANAAKQSSEAMVAVELPIFVYEKIDMQNRPFKFSIAFGNHGRTPAIITGHCLVFTTEAALPPVPRYPLGSLVKVDRPSVVEKGDEYLIERPWSLSPEESERVFRRESILRVYGYIEYRDFLKIERRDGFCLGFDPVPDSSYPTMTPSHGRWVQEGPATYTYSKPKSEIL